MNSRKPRRFDWQAIKHRLEPREVGSDCDADDCQSRLEKVYRERMLEYASRQPSRPDRSSRRQLVVCSIGGRDFGIDIARVVKVIPLSQCVGVPGAPTEVIGVVNVAGEIYSIVDAAALVGASSSGDDRPAGERQALLLRGTESNVALQVQSVKAIDTVDTADVCSPDGTHGFLPSPLEGEDLRRAQPSGPACGGHVEAEVRSEKRPEIAAAGCVAGVTPEGLIVLDMDKLLSHPIFSLEKVCK